MEATTAASNDHNTKLGPDMPVQSPCPATCATTPLPAPPPTTLYSLRHPPHIDLRRSLGRHPYVPLRRHPTGNLRRHLTCTATLTCRATPTYVTTQMNDMPLDQSYLQVQTPGHPSHPPHAPSSRLIIAGPPCGPQPDPRTRPSCLLAPRLARPPPLAPHDVPCQSSPCHICAVQVAAAKVATGAPAARATKVNNMAQVRSCDVTLHVSPCCHVVPCATP